MADIFEKFDPNDDRHQAQVRQLAEDLAAQGPTKRILHEQEKEHFEFKPGALGRLYGSRVRQQAFLNNIHHMIHPRTKQVCHLGGLAKVGMNCPGCGKDGHYLALITRAQNDRGGEWWWWRPCPAAASSSGSTCPTRRSRRRWSRPTSTPSSGA